MKYFKGPIEDIANLFYNEQTCLFCNEVKTLSIPVDFAISDKYSRAEKENKMGCLDCLRKGEFEIWHDTEFGMLEKDGFKKVYLHHMENPPKVLEQNKIELRRTPQIQTSQQELWLTHCNDFMVYKGTWEPIDFVKNSSNSNGRELFLSMTDVDMNHLWDDYFEEGGILTENWYATYYVFECSHCKKLRGNWDCD